MFAAMMAGGTFTYPRPTSSPTTYDQTGAATVQFSPPIGVTTLYVDANAGGGAEDNDDGGGQGAWADNLAITCAANDLFELTFTTESGRGRRIKLLQNGSTVFDLRGGVNGGAGGDAVTPALTGGALGTSTVDPGAGANTSYLSGTVYSGSGGWDDSGSPGLSSYLSTYWPDIGVPFEVSPGVFYTEFLGTGPGAKSASAGLYASGGYQVGFGGMLTELYDTTGSPVFIQNITYNPDIARCVITW